MSKDTLKLKLIIGFLSLLLTLIGFISFFFIQEFRENTILPWKVITKIGIVNTGSKLLINSNCDDSSMSIINNFIEAVHRKDKLYLTEHISNLYSFDEKNIAIKFWFGMDFNDKPDIFICHNQGADKIFALEKNKKYFLLKFEEENGILRLNLNVEDDFVFSAIGNLLLDLQNSKQLPQQLDYFQYVFERVKQILVLKKLNFDRHDFDLYFSMSELSVNSNEVSFVNSVIEMFNRKDSKSVVKLVILDPIVAANKDFAINYLSIKGFGEKTNACILFPDGDIFFVIFDDHRGANLSVVRRNKELKIINLSTIGNYDADIRKLKMNIDFGECESLRVKV